MTLERAVEVFVQAFSAGKSRTYPYVVTRPDPWLWVMQDTPARKDSRKVEAVSVSGNPERTVERIRGLGLAWHFVCEIHSDASDFDRIRAEYKALGYRAVSTEWLFVHDLMELPTANPIYQVVPIFSAVDLDGIPQAAYQKRRLLPGTTMFSVHTESLDLGWVTHVPVGTDSWVSDLWVQPEHRGRGIGRALMTSLLHHAKSRGDESSILLASSDGAQLYPKLGYQQIAILQLFCPAKR